MQFRKKPVVIEARQLGHGYDEDADIMRWCGGKSAVWADGVEELFYIETLNGRVAVSQDEWIIRGVEGEFYPCKPDIFEATYEPAASQRTEPSTFTASTRTMTEGPIPPAAPSGSPQFLYEMRHEPSTEPPQTIRVSRDLLVRADSYLSLLWYRPATKHDVDLQIQVPNVIGELRDSYSLGIEAPPTAKGSSQK